MRSAPRSGPRWGFTLVELLIVMAIIAVLASLSISAVFSLRESQTKNFTEATIQKLASALDQQWKATLDQIYEETPAGWAMTLANNDLRRARVIYAKGRLRQEFPVDFLQATTPIVFASGGGIAPKAAYQQSLQGVTVNPAWSSSAMLFMVLSQARRGMAAFDPASLVEPTAIRSETVNGKTFQYFVDGWGNPLRFFIFPTGNDEINQEPYIRTADGLGNPIRTAHDVQDPEDTLMSAAWPTALRNVFASNIHALLPPGNPARHLIPVVASPGKDGAWGIDPYAMSPVAPLEDANDNIYSYRLRRFGARGD